MRKSTMSNAALLASALAMSAFGALAAEQPARRAKTGDQKQEAKKPNPCASYGPGFTMLPGTTTCVRVGGSVVGDFGAGRGSAPNLGVK